MTDMNNARVTIADKIHQAVNALLETELRLNADLIEARDIAREQKAEIHRLQDELASEQADRRRLQDILGAVQDLVVKA